MLTVAFGHKFSCVITGLKMSMTMLILVSRARQRPMKTLNQWRKWFWIIIESLLERLLVMLAYRSAHAKHYEYFRHDTCGSENRSKIAKFWAITTSQGDHSGDANDIHWMNMTLKTKSIGEIQLHTIDNVLRIWTDGVGYCMASRGSHLNKIIPFY